MNLRCSIINVNAVEISIFPCFKIEFFSKKYLKKLRGYLAEATSKFIIPLKELLSVLE